jgi:hypothetical protein
MRGSHRTFISKFVEYYHALNAGDRSGWERAFEETWHPEAIIDGLSVTRLKELHRQRLGSGDVVNVHVLRSLDANRIEYSTEARGKYAGPFVATFRAGRIYRVL